MGYKLSKMNSARLILLCLAAYFVSYLTRVNYSAVLVEIIADEGYSKVSASGALTGLFITYGFGQIITGYMGDRFTAEHLPFAGLLLAGAMNFLIPFAPSAAVMTVIWCINGFAQALMWPPIVKILTQYLSAKSFKKNIIYVGYGGLIGTIFIYLFVPLLITVSGWRAVFFFSAASAAVMAAVWIMCIRRIEKQADALEDYTVKEERKVTKQLTKKAGVLIILIMVAIVMQGILRDGISTWMPTYISDTFNIKSSISILTGIGLPILGMMVSYLASWMNRRLVSNELSCCAFMFAMCAICSTGLFLLGKSGPVFSVCALTLTNAFTHGINTMLTCMIIPAFKPFGRVSFFSGLFNSATYIGSAISMFGIALISQHIGWSATILSWCFTAAAGFIISAAGITKLAIFKKHSSTSSTN